MGKRKHGKDPGAAQPPKKPRLATFAPKFSVKMKQCIKDGGMLSDEHINLAQKLLTNQFSHIDGFQNCLLSQNNGFLPVQHEAIQIHHVSGNHWVTSCSFGGEVSIYDSKYLGILQPSLTHQLALIYRSLVDKNDSDDDEEAEFAELCAHIPAVQQQKGGMDCGLFSIAFALHLALGDDLKKLIFHQDAMRQHLIKCFLDKKLEPFPHKKVAVTPKGLTLAGSYLPFRQIDLFCTCLMPDTYGDMVACDECERWYHIKCVKLQQCPKEEEKWTCKECSKN